MLLLRRYQRVVLYVLVGACLALIYSGLTAALILWNIVPDRTLASAIASVLTIPLSYFAHRRTTYRDVRHQTASGWRFAMVACCTFFIATGTMSLTAILGLPFWIALVVSWVLIPIGNYTINAVWVFRTKTLWSLNDGEA